VREYDYKHLSRLTELRTTHVGNFELFEQAYVSDA
jgi:hypothetical protein